MAMNVLFDKRNEAMSTSDTQYTAREHSNNFAFRL